LQSPLRLRRQADPVTIGAALITVLCDFPRQTATSWLANSCGASLNGPNAGFFLRSKQFASKGDHFSHFDRSNLSTPVPLHDAGVPISPAPAAPAAAATLVSIKGPGRFLFVDALRGVAAMSVLLFHFYGHLSQWGQVERLPHPIHLIITNGDQGVFIFFVLSGFVIAYTVGQARITPQYLGRFALRRSLRLDPPYWTIILVTYAYLYAHQQLTGIAPRTGFWNSTTLPTNFLYLNKLLQRPTIVTVGWTLCLEIQFYLVYVIVTGLMQQLAALCGGWIGLARTLAFAPLVAYSLALSTGLVAELVPGLFATYWYLFFLGVCVAWVLMGQIRPVWAWSLIGLTAITAFRGPPLQTTVGVVTAVAVLALGQLGRLRDTWNWRWIQYLARISYSLYLVHPLVGHRILELLLRHTPPGEVPSPLWSVIGFVTATGASFLAAHLMNLWLERPAQALSRRVRLRGD
jgi:peptidoglycan/LPS O-acetylase OafA/YrhL